MRYLIFGLLVVLTLHMASFSAIAPVYAMLLRGQALSAPTAIIAVGLDLGWLSLLVATGIACTLKISLPAHVYSLRPGGIVWRGVGLFVWLLSLAASSGAMLMAAGHMLPDPIPNDLILALIISWPMFETIASLMPILLITPPKPPVGPRDLPVPTDRTHETRLEPPDLDGPEQQVIWLLDDIGNGHEVGGAHLSSAGDIVTTQRALGRALGFSAATVNRILRSLALAGLIRLTTTTNGTRVRII